MAYTFYEKDNRVIRYADALANRGDQVEVIALRADGLPREGSLGRVRVHRIQRRSVTERHAWNYLLKILWFFIQTTVLLTVLQLRRRYDIVHVHNVPDFLVFTAMVPKLMGARVILDIHDIVPELYAGKFGAAQGSGVFRALLAVERLSCRFANHVIVANHLWHTKLVQRTVPAHKCTTIMNYPDLSLFRPLPADERCHDRNFIMLYPGTLNHHQGLDIAVRAFALAAPDMPGAVLHIYGQGPGRQELAQMIPKLGLQTRVRLMDQVPLNEVSKIMAAADVGVVPKRADGFGNEAFSTKILEFMACGVPVIVSRTKVDAHYFDDTLVRFFEPGDDAALASAMRWVYAHRLEHEAWVRNARDYAVGHSWQARVIDYQALIESLLRPLTGPQTVTG